jgi:hypothetical protein
VEQNAPVPLYDTSGPYTDPDARIDLTHGLPPRRAAWIEDLQDTEELIGPSSEYARLREDDLLALFQRFPSVPRPRRARSGKNVTQMHYARKGTGQAPRNPSALRELRKRVPNVPLIVDAGIGLPSQACQVMEWGFDAVLVNTAVSRANDPITMAGAFAEAVRAGRTAYLGGPMIVQELAVPSTPGFGRPFSTESAVVAAS